MTQKIVIAGSGFAGMWAAVSAARAVSLAGKEKDIEVIVVSPTASLTIRPRLYEAVLENMNPDLAPLFDAVGVRHMAGLVQTIDAGARLIEIGKNDGTQLRLPYDKFVLAAGSRLFQPPVPGLAEHTFNVDQLESARRLDIHLQSLADRPETVARNTVVVAGGGFTGIETVAEMPERLRAILGSNAAIRVVVVEQAPHIGPDLGPVPRPVIEQALAECGVEIITGAAVNIVSADSVTLSSGERIQTNTVIWTAGARANPLAAQIPGERDHFGRVIGDAFLHATEVTDIFVTGDVVRATTDHLGNTTLMSCQHAQSLGRVAGHNAAAELVGLPLHPYSQPKYVTCLDIGPWGALYTEGWDRQVHLTRDAGKALKQEINTTWIYPPPADRNAAFAVANPDFVIVP
ncbi:FAD-dependent oxidoreductase [Microvirga sp. HBU67558]|uniref:NAD(P)/FAD-dependent oxidoreductase n=1 Tax=Microvirga TaxID=186650 RepID=UPI001B36E0D0|nr:MULTISPECIES: FAD-dependent oxidoreductase [unclassified Microvirga]MBQ0822619.1 FAD-dependent oxidoreductase [Microvirga sp. HBU67558]